MGEFEFIESVRRAFSGVGHGDGGEGGYLGIGDDCAVLPIGGGDAFVVTTDMLVEGVHFLRRAGSEHELKEAHELGAKSLAVNLSDIAAMGARPTASFLSIALPPECRGGNGRNELTGRSESDQPSRSAEDGDGENVHGSWASEFMEGYREMSLRHGVGLTGGDTTASKNGVAINVTVIGRAPLDRLKYRSGARLDDIVVVGGPLGESAAGLADILAGRHDTALATVHRNPVPQVAEGEWLGTRPEIHSMIDLSDGLASDLVHILRASCVAAEIELAAIPTPVSLELAVTGGEDYKLLFTVAPEDYDRLAEDYLARFGAPLYPVGRIVPTLPDTVPAIIWLQNGEPITKDWHGFVHF